MNDRNSLSNPQAVAPSGKGGGGDTRMRCYPLKMLGESLTSSTLPAPTTHPKA